MRPLLDRQLPVRSVVLVLGLAGTSVAQCVMGGTAAYWNASGPGCGTPPTLGALNLPVLGTTCVLRTSNLSPNALFVVTWITTSPPGLPTTTLLGFPFGAGCSNYIPAPEAYVLNYVWSGSVDVALSIPANAAWIGHVVTAQSAVLDVFSAAINFPEVSNGVCLYPGN
jgi:hypothetical protein